MEKIIWSEDYSMGIQSLDGQHQKIIDYVNTLIDYYNNDISSKNIADICDELLSLAYSHFEYEEILLKELDYPELELKQHTDVHSAFKDIITELVIKSINRNDQKIPVEILQFMKDWWVDHILKEDMKYKPFLISNLASSKK